MDKSCKHCWRGTVKDPRALGAELARVRADAGLTLRQLADKMKMSPQYLSDLERGRRQWTPKLEERYLRALERASAAA